MTDYDKIDMIYHFDRPVKVEYDTVNTIGISNRLHKFLQAYSKMFCNVDIPELYKFTNKEHQEVLAASQVQKIGKAMLTHEDTWLSSLYSDRREREKEYAKKIGIKIEDIYLRRVWKLRNHFLEGGGIRMHWDYKTTGFTTLVPGEYWPIQNYEGSASMIWLARANMPPGLAVFAQIRADKETEDDS